MELKPIFRHGERKDEAASNRTSVDLEHLLAVVEPRGATLPLIGPVWNLQALGGEKELLSRRVNGEPEVDLAGLAVCP